LIFTNLKQRIKRWKNSNNSSKRFSSKLIKSKLNQTLVNTTFSKSSPELAKLQDHLVFLNRQLESIWSPLFTMLIIQMRKRTVSISYKSSNKQPKTYSMNPQLHCITHKIQRLLPLLMTLKQSKTKRFAAKVFPTTSCAHLFMAHKIRKFKSL